MGTHTPKTIHCLQRGRFRQSLPPSKSLTQWQRLLGRWGVKRAHPNFHPSFKGGRKCTSLPSRSLSCPASWLQDSWDSGSTFRALSYQESGDPSARTAYYTFHNPWATSKDLDRVREARAFKLGRAQMLLDPSSALVYYGSVSQWDQLWAVL